eukprot:TRINITY_DN10698_c0_g1_i1.p1 TRINITY_DN10698_c0_g1~~TRINITY_DN10698_c0_g1_i1.p1  ORF type:complete len:396 (+),score=65.86 TRINITY_DN10698_c0_g1_i1:18-1205(+)
MVRCLMPPSPHEICGLAAAPAPEKVVLDAQQVQRLADALMDQLLDALRLVIKGRHRGQDAGPQARGPAHQLQMPLVQRGLAHHEHQGPLLLEGDVRGPHQQVVVKGVGNGRESLDGAGGHQHAPVAEGAAGRGGGQVVHLVDPGGHGLDLLHGVLGFDGQVLGPGLAEDQVARLVQLGEHLQGLHPVDDPAGPGYAQYQRQRHLVLPHLLSSASSSPTKASPLAVICAMASWSRPSQWMPAVTTTLASRAAERASAVRLARASSLCPTQVKTEAVELVTEGSARLGRGAAMATAPMWGASPPQMQTSRSGPIQTAAACMLQLSALVFTMTVVMRPSLPPLVLYSYPLAGFYAGFLPHGPRPARLTGGTAEQGAQLIRSKRLDYSPPTRSWQAVLP